MIFRTYTFSKRGVARMFSSHRFAEALIDSPTLGIWLVSILNGSSTTLHSDSPDLPHHATHTHEARSSCFDHAAHSSSKDLRRERVVAELRVQPTFLCRAASPAGASRERATHVFAACRPRRAPSAACYRAGSWGVLQCSAFEPTIVLFSAEFGLGMSTGVTKSSKNITKKYKQPFLEP